MTEQSPKAPKRAWIMDSRHTPLWRYMLGIQAVASLLPAAFFASFGAGFGGVYLFSLLFSFPVLWGCGLPFLVKRLSSSSVNQSVAAETKAALERWAAKPIKAADYAVTLTSRKQVTGTAIAFDGEALYVVDQGEAIRLLPEEVVSWRWNVEETKQVMLFGAAKGNFGMNLDAGEINQKMANAAYDASGLTLTIRDLKKPNWRFNSNNIGVMERWDAILHQVLNSPA